MKAYDLLVQAETALCSVTGRPEGPGRVGASVCDIACGMAAYAGVLEALIARGISGRGSGLAVSLFDGMADWMNVPLLSYEGTGRAPPRIGLAHPSVAPYGAFALEDGGQVLISIQNEREWGAFCREVMRDPGFATDARFASNVARVRNRAALDAAIAAVFATLDRAGITQRLNAAGTAYGFVNEVADLARHPALRRITVGTPNGEVAYAAPPVRWADGARSYSPVPAIGQHDAMIRAEFAG
jgi:crotonobetainyl-CoA:carnitine CoA-transferase CaiB-like acyl-CoA transferase